MSVIIRGVFQGFRGIEARGESMAVDKEADHRDYVEVDVRVRYAETDQMGVAYYGSYVVWFEVGRSEYCRAKGFSYRMVTFGYRILRKETQEVVVYGETRHLCLNKRGNPSSMPEKFLSRLKS